MSRPRWSVSLIAVIGLLAVAMSGAMIWLLVTDPVTAADVVGSAVSEGDVSPLMRALGAVLYDALRGLFKYL
jgi:hypothetical protein